jgi:coenzyme F420-reducing hydrogenase gamma subunit
MKKPIKPQVAFFDLTGCNGCLLSVLFNEDEILQVASQIDIKTFRFITDVKNQEYDIAFVEGLVATNKDLEVLEEIRKKAKVLIALGACACTGCIPATRNFTDPERYVPALYEKIKELGELQPLPIDNYVKVDYYVPGCPPSGKQLMTFIKDLLLSKVPYEYDRPVCFECKLAENRCLLKDGKMCLGTITKGGCDAVCTSSKYECWGCRGPTTDANIDLLRKFFEEKGFTKDQVKTRLRTFMGLKIEGKPEWKVLKPLKELARSTSPKKVIISKLTEVKKNVVVKSKSAKITPVKKAVAQKIAKTIKTKDKQKHKAVKIKTVVKKKSAKKIVKTVAKIAVKSSPKKTVTKTVKKNVSKKAIKQKTKLKLK